MKSLLSIKKTGLLALLLLAQHGFTFAQTAPAAVPATSNSLWFNGAFIILSLTVVILLCVITILGKILKTLVEEDTKEVIKNRRATASMIILALLSLGTLSAHAQDVAAAVAPSSPLIAGMDQTLFWAMISTISIEFIVVLMLLRVLFGFLVKKGLVQPMGSIFPKWLQWKTMVGDDIPLEKEAELLTDHDYDGIQELDNGMPPMLKYIFLATVITAIVYWGYYETFAMGSSQLEEYQQEIAQGEADKAEYLKKAGNLVDENNVTLLSEAAAIADGQKIYATNCVACHGDKGQGGVGPNFTDNYWIHGGGIQNVFKTIKYGFPAKGMRSWQSEIKPADMQAVASFVIKEFGGKNIAGGKAPQGELYNEPAAPAAADSSKSKVTSSDSTQKK